MSDTLTANDITIHPEELGEGTLAAEILSTEPTPNMGSVATAIIFALTWNGRRVGSRTYWASLMNDQPEQHLHAVSAGMPTDEEPTWIEKVGLRVRRHTQWAVVWDD